MEEQVAKLVGSMRLKGSIVGNIPGVVELQGTVQNKKVISASIVAPTLISLPTYKGPYEIYPKVTQQDFETKDTRMASDLSVKAIPYHEVRNESGDTVIIGGI